MYNPFFKRLFDIFASLAALIVLGPLMIVVGLIIKSEDGGPAFFRQDRVGKGGKMFRIFKFRSMPVNTAELTSAEARQVTITKMGRFIRRTNIDELPQLINILRGDMSVVGPRPPIAKQVALIEWRRENGALDCLPGLTGLAQVSAYDGMPEDEKSAFDGVYAKKVTFVGDVTIILRTVIYLFKPQPVY